MYNVNNIALLFDISGGEFLVILLFILMFFGSKNIPDLARGLGRGYRQLKDATNSIKREIQTGTGDMGSLKDIGESIKRPLDKHIEDIKKSIGDVDTGIKKDMNKLDQELDDELNK